MLAKEILCGLPESLLSTEARVDEEVPLLQGHRAIALHHPDSFAKLTGRYLSEKLHDPLPVCAEESAKSPGVERDRPGDKSSGF